MCTACGRSVVAIGMGEIWCGMVETEEFAWSVWSWNDDLQTMKASAESAFINPEQIESLTREKIGGFAISFSSAVSYTIELRHRHRTVQLPISDTIVWAKLEQMFTDESSVKFAFQTKTLLEILWKVGFDLKGHISDPRVAHWLMNSDDKKSPTMSELHLRYVVDPKHENAHLHAHYSQSQVPVGQQSADARVHGAHVWQCWRTMRQLVQLLERRGMLRTFKEVEMPLLRVLACMEWAGLGFRRAPCVRYAREAQTKITYLEMRANVLAGRDIDLNSPKDCGHVLFNDLGLHVPTSAHINARGDPNCNKAVLDQMLDAHPLVAIIKEHRLLCHYMRFYMKPLPEKARWDARFSMHRIHATFLQVSTSTGRVTMSFPNLQNVSKCIQFQPLRRLNIQQEIEAGADFSYLLLRRPTEDCAVVAVSTREPGARVFGTLRDVQTNMTIEEPFGAGDMCLVDYWESKGFEYTQKQRSTIVQVKVELNFGKDSNMILSYPADKVWRLSAVIPDQTDSGIQDQTDSELKNYPGKEIKFSVRDSFIAAKGCVLLSADYAQIEIRIMAHFSGDDQLRSVIQSGGDVILKVASNWLKIPEEQITPEQRTHAKSIMYGMLYGQGPSSLALELGVSRPEAEQFMKSFRSQYPGLETFTKSTVSEGAARGHITTLLGRRRALPNLNAKDARSRSQAQRQAVNSVCQGSAADLIKVAMVQIHGSLRRLDRKYVHRPIPEASTGTNISLEDNNNISPPQSNHTPSDPQLNHIPSDQQSSHPLSDPQSTHLPTDPQSNLPPSDPQSNHLPSGRLVLQIHDELLIEVREDAVNDVAALVRKHMESCIKLNVPLSVRIKVGRTWGYMQPLEEFEEKT
eukprot:812669_1